MTFSINSMHLGDAKVTAEKFGSDYRPRNDLLLGGNVDLRNIELDKINNTAETKGINIYRTLRVLGCLTLLLPILAGCMNKDTSKQEANIPPSNVPTVVASAIPTEKPVVSSTNIPQETTSPTVINPTQADSNQSVIPEMVGDIPEGHDVIKMGEIACVRSLDLMPGYAYNPKTKEWPIIDTIRDNTPVRYWGYLDPKYEDIMDATRSHRPDEQNKRSWVLVSRLHTPSETMAILAPWVKRSGGVTNEERIDNCLGLRHDLDTPITYPEE